MLPAAGCVRGLLRPAQLRALLPPQLPGAGGRRRVKRWLTVRQEFPANLGLPGIPMSILSRDPDLSRKPPETLKKRAVFGKNDG